MTSGFQQQVYAQPALGVAGDFANSNPFFTLAAGPGGLVAGLAGVTIGRFAWIGGSLDSNGTPQTVLNTGFGPVSGFVGREQQGLNSTFLSDAGMIILAGLPVTLYTGGAFLVVNDGTTEATRGMKAYADLATGKVSFAATGAPTQGGSVTASVAASTFSVTGSLAGNIMTVTAVGSGVVRPGSTISGASIASGTKVLSQISGTAGGIGTYYVDIPEQTAASTTISGTYGTMTVTAVGSGAISLNGILAGSGVDAGTKVTQFITGTGGNGTYAVDSNTVVNSTTITETSTVETKWVAMSSGLAGEIVKIDSQPTG